MKDGKKFTSVSLPIELVEKIKTIIKDTGFVSVGSYVEYILREMVILHSQHRHNKKILSGQDKEILSQKLKALGYM